MAAQIFRRAVSTTHGIAPVPRAVRHMIAKLVTKSSEGTTMKRPVSVWLSGPDHSFASIGALVGEIFLASKPSRFNPVTNMHPRTCSLLFDHVSRQITHVSSTLPYLEMPQDLPGKHAQARGLATLYALGDIHTIGLSGMGDLTSIGGEGES